MLFKLKQSFKVNKVVKYFVLSDLVVFSGWGFVVPIFSIFVIENIKNAGIFEVGVSAFIYWTARSLVQLPVANFLDRTKGEKDDLYVLLSGLIIASASGYLFTLIHTISALYILQTIHGVAFGFYAPAWSAIFSRHLDKTRVAFDYSLDNVALGLASGITGFLGGYLASLYGFNLVFIAASVFSLAAAVLIFTVPDLVLPQPKGFNVKPELDHTPRSISQ